MSDLSAQPIKSHNSADILQQIKKLKVLGSVLYVAAHPDDENTRLIAYLSGERLFRTGYLSLTRGDGGQNLIGGELGISLGLIRTQELLAARRHDGADQFFSRAFDFGYSKNPEETFEVWNKEKILSDAVWVIRTFKPDVIIARFPEDSRAGHGHHTASGIIAHEAFIAAADATKFPEQLRKGLKPWKAKRLLWNTYSFGGNSTISEDQFKFDVGGYNPLLGKSYGEISAESRSEHKSQGFGVPSSRGQDFEYFETIAGEKPTKEIMDGVEYSWAREGMKEVERLIQNIILSYQASSPESSVPQLLNLYKMLTEDTRGTVADNRTLREKYSGWKKIKAAETAAIIRSAMGLFFEATANTQYAAMGDSLNIRFNVINRSDVKVKDVKVSYNGNEYTISDQLKNNINAVFDLRNQVTLSPVEDQPYWLRMPSEKGSFVVEDEELIGLAKNQNERVQLSFTINGVAFKFNYPLQYKYTDPVKGEVRQPVITVPPVVVSMEPGFVFTGIHQKKKEAVTVQIQALSNLGKQQGSVIFRNGKSFVKKPIEIDLIKNKVQHFKFDPSQIYTGKDNSTITASVEIEWGDRKPEIFDQSITIINYDHIPTVHFLHKRELKVITEEIKTAGIHIGYIAGAGDKIQESLQAMGYIVTLLAEADLNTINLKQFDAVITGIRAYNVHSFLTEKYDVLMEYVNQGGNLIVQYNTNSMIGPVRSRISPYPFNITRSRVTDENALVKFDEPEHKVLNFPNKITRKDFEGWVQERGLYFADQLSPEFKSPLLMNDPGEKGHGGSLVIADYGKGKFVYTGLSFFRQLPAGVPGAYKLLANIIGLNK